MSEPTESCQSCKFWKENRISGDCRRFPPVDIVRIRDGDSTVGAEFPTTYPTEWCGEYVKGEVKL